MRVMFLFIFLCASTISYAENNGPVTAITSNLYYPGSAKIGKVKQKNFKGISYACVTVTAKNGEGNFVTQVSMAAKEDGEWYVTDKFKSMNACLGMTNDLYYNWKKQQASRKKQDEADKKQENDEKMEKNDEYTREDALGLSTER
jgi:hypothetical protein